MPCPETIQDYLRACAPELGERIIQMFPALHKPGDPVSPRMKTLLRKPYPAQELAAMGVIRRWEQARSAAVIGECGTGKTLVAMAAIHCHSDGRPYTALAMVPGHLVAKTAREAFRTLPGVRVFFIDALRDRVRDGAPCGVNEVKLRHGRIVREGLHTTLTDLRLRKHYRTARERWQGTICSGPALFILGRDRAKLGWFWRHAYEVAHCGRYQGSVVNPDTERPVYVGDDRLLASDFQKVRHSEIIGEASQEEGDRSVKSRRGRYSPLWQADGQRIRRVAPLEFIGRYLPDWFDYGIGDEVHQLTAGDTAQGNALGTLATCTGRLVVLTAVVEEPVRKRFSLDVMPVDITMIPGLMAPESHWVPRRLFSGTDVLFLPGTRIHEEADGSWVLLDKDGAPSSYRMPKDGYYFDDVSFNRREGIDPAKFHPVDDIADAVLKQIEEYSSQLYHGTDCALLGWGGVCFLGLSIITDPRSNVTMGMPDQWMMMLLTEKETCHEMMNRSVEASIKCLDPPAPSRGRALFCLGNRLRRQRNAARGVHQTEPLGGDDETSLPEPL